MQCTKILSALAPFALTVLAFVATLHGQDQRQQERGSARQGAKESAQATAGKQESQIEMTKQALVQLHAINQMETELALSGINQADTEQVREFANTLAEAHQENDRDLMQHARELEVEIAATQDATKAMQQLKEKTRSIRQDLQQAKGKQFDRAFLDGAVKTHEMAIQQLQSRLKNEQNPQVTQLIQQRVDSMQQHLKQARDLQRQMAQGQQ